MNRFAIDRDWPRPRAPEALLLALACLAPWAFGSVEAWAQLALEVGLVLVTALGWLGRRGPGWRRDLLCTPSLALGGLVLLAVLQATPLPGNLLGRASPSAAALRSSLVPDRSERVAGDPGAPVRPPAPTLSQEPGATLDTAARLAAAWLLFQGVLGLGGGPRPLRRFGLALAGNATLLALFALIQALTWNGKIYWLRPTSGGRWTTGGPFVCHTHLAESLNLGLGFAMAALLSGGLGRAGSDGKWARILAPYAAGLLVVGIVASNSRGGFLAMSAALALLVLLRPWAAGGRGPARSGSPADRGRPWRVGAGVVAFGALVALLLLALGDASPYGQRLATILNPSDRGYQARSEVWESALAAWRDHPAWGTGFGSFAEATAPYNRRDRGTFWSAAENEYVQMLAEGGLIGLGLALVALAGILRLARRALVAARAPGERAVVAGALAGGLALGIQCVSDFGLHVPGVAVAATMLCAHLCRSGLRAGEGPDDPPPQRAGRGAGFVLAGALMVALSLAVAARGVGQARAEALLVAAGLPVPGFAMPVVDRPVLSGPDLDRRRLALEAALRLRPDWTEGHLRLGQIRLGLYEDAAAGAIDASAHPSAAKLMADPTWLLGIAHPDGGGPPPTAEEWLEHEPIRLHLVPAARSFLEARRCCPVSAMAQAELAGLDFLLLGGEPASAYGRRALRLASDEPTLNFLARVASRAGDLDLAADCWRKALGLGGTTWEEVADAAGAALPPDQLLAKVVSSGGRDALRFGDRLYATPEDRGARELFLKAAVANLPADPDLPPGERIWLEARARDRLGETARARGLMTAALDADPLRGDRRREFVDRLIAWGDPREAHEQALIGVQLDPADPKLRRLLALATQALAAGAPAARAGGR